MTEIIEIFVYILMVIIILFTIYMLIDIYRTNKEIKKMEKEFDDLMKQQMNELHEQLYDKIKQFRKNNPSKIIIDGDNMKEIRKEE